MQSPSTAVILSMSKDRQRLRTGLSKHDTIKATLRQAQGDKQFLTNLKLLFQNVSKKFRDQTNVISNEVRDLNKCAYRISRFARNNTQNTRLIHR